MKKRLLLTLALALGTMSTFAYNEGERIFTPTARLRLTGSNLVTNGSFADRFTGWLGQEGNAVDETNWSFTDNGGPDGERVAVSGNGGDGLNNYLYKTVALPSAGTYVVSFKIKGVEGAGNVSTTTTVGSANYVDAYVNNDGSINKSATGFRQIFTATDNIIKEGWTEITDTLVYNDGEAGYLVIGVGRLDAGTEVTDFEVWQATVTYDTRVAQRRLEYDKKIMALDEFPVKNEEMEEIIPLLEQGLANDDLSALGLDIDDTAAVNGFMSQLVELETEYLDANSYDLVAGGVVTGPGLWVNKLQKGSGTYGDWYITGGRWMHSANAADVRDDMPGSYALPANKIEIQKALPAGKYFFQIEAYGYTMTGKKNTVDNNWYDPDYNTPVTNQLYIGSDSATVDTLSANEWRTYFFIADVPEGAETSEKNLVAGCVHSAHAKGGLFYYRNPVLRIVSTTGETDITRYDQNNKKNTQLTAAKTMIDSANVVVDKTEYPWGKETLRAAIAAQQSLYDALEATDVIDANTGKALGLVVRDADGNPVVDANENTSTKTVADSLTQVMRDMRTAIQAYYGENAPLTDLVAKTAEAQSTIDDPVNAGASAATRTTLQTEINNANAIIATFKTQTDSVAGDLAKSQAQVLALQTAIENLTATTANYANPSEIEIKNPLMASTKSGWTVTESNSSKGPWKKSNNKEFEGGTALVLWRGYSAYEKNTAKQEVELTHAGAYEIVMQAYAYNENGGRDGNVQSNNNVFFFARETASADSIGAIHLHTNRSYVDTLGYGGSTPEWFVITYNKPDNTPTTIEFGLDGSQNTSSNTYCFGGNHIRYYGDAAQYKADVLSTLQAEIAKAQGTLTTYAEVSDSVEYKALNNAVIAATSAIDGVTLAYPISSTVKAPFLMSYVGWVEPSDETAAKRYATTATADDEKAALETKALLQLQRAETKFAAKDFNISTGINSVNAGAVKAAAKGVYSISGQKVAESAKNLPAGLYIVNGKKVVVK